MILAIPVPLIGIIVTGIVELARIIRDIWTSEGRRKMAERKVAKIEERAAAAGKAAVERYHRRHGRMRTR
jgi:hypothetical protein